MLKKIIFCVFVSRYVSLIFDVWQEKKKKMSGLAVFADRYEHPDQRLKAGREWYERHLASSTNAASLSSSSSSSSFTAVDSPKEACTA